MRWSFILLAVLLSPNLTQGAAVVTVLLRTDKGDIEVDLDAKRAPVTVKNFLRYVDAGHYDDGKFHRTVHADNQPINKVKIAVIQAGVAAKKKEFAPIVLERTNKTGLKHLDGVISMARDGPDTATGDFFICVGDQPELDFGGKRNPDGQGFAAFGKVVRGMEVVRAINTSASKEQKLDPPIRIRSIRRLSSPLLVAHRGLFRDAPENTLAAFRACLALRLGLELDVRRSKDGQLVVLHDDTLNRTTDGKGKVNEMTLAELKKLDAGVWFDAAFSGERIPTLEEVFALVKEHGHADTLVTVDLKIDDGKVEAEVVALAKKHGVLSRIVCIGTAIESVEVRKRLRVADRSTPVAALAQTAEDLAKALVDEHSDWAYVRFVPTADQVQLARMAKKKVIVVGKVVMEREVANWIAARKAGVDAILTDYPLDCRAEWRKR